VTDDEGSGDLTSIDESIPDGFGVAAVTDEFTMYISEDDVRLYFSSIGPLAGWTIADGGGWYKGIYPSAQEALDARSNLDNW
jgi:hypothetical protein